MMLDLLGTGIAIQIFLTGTRSLVAVLTGPADSVCHIGTLT